MSNMSDFSVGLAHELCITAHKAGFTPDELGVLAKSEEKMRQFHQVLLGHASVQTVEHMIDCDAEPYLPDGWKIEKHQKGGQFDWSATSVKFYLDSDQQNGECTEGNKLRKELSGKPVLNANVLDYLLKNPNLIPEDWKKNEKGNTRYIFFWGTIYRNSGGSLCVRCLFWNGVEWRSLGLFLNDDWSWNHPAALRAS
jgi:hypothetical protein